MVDKLNSIDAVNSAKQIKAEEAKKAEEKKAEEDKKVEKNDKTDSFQATSSYFADYQIKDFVKQYVDRLISKYEGYNDIISRLNSYMGTFDVDKFKKLYPDLSSNSDLATALYNETAKFL